MDDNVSNLNWAVLAAPYDRLRLAALSNNIEVWAWPHWETYILNHGGHRHADLGTYIEHGFPFDTLDLNVDPHNIHSIYGSLTKHRNRYHRHVIDQHSLLK